MAWDGYWKYGGNEIVNLPRTEVYAKDAIWFRPSGAGTDLALMANGGEYVSPIVDNAPWTDPDDPASYDFWGFYPLGVSGTEDATVTSVVVESTGDGGSPGRVRRGTKTLVFNGMLLAASECGADYGMKWLRSVLNGNACGNLATQTCNGDDLCFLACEPALNYDYAASTLMHADVAVDGGSAWGAGSQDAITGGGGAVITTNFDTLDGCDADLDCAGFSSVTVTPGDCLDDATRSLRQVVFNNGPTVTGKRITSDNGAIWTVTFTAVAGNPYEFGVERQIVEGFMDSTITNPYVPGVDGSVDMAGYIVSNTDSCPTEIITPVFDPLCPALVVPPTIPNIPLGCYTPPANWRRRQFTVPNTLIPLHSDAVPLLRAYARDSDVRNLRLRFYSDVNGDGSVLDDPCAWCGDIVISYIPQDMTLVFDGSDQVIYVQNPGGVRRRADNLVFATDGGPFEWPSLTCGFQYIVTVDLPQYQTPPVMDFSIYNRVA